MVVERQHRLAGLVQDERLTARQGTEQVTLDAKVLGGGQAGQRH